MVSDIKRKHRKRMAKLVESLSSLKPKLVHLLSPLEEGLQWLVSPPEGDLVRETSQKTTNTSQTGKILNDT